MWGWEKLRQPRFHISPNRWATSNYLDMLDNIAFAEIVRKKTLDPPELKLKGRAIGTSETKRD
ncbi:protein of unknown function [Aminobacter niigataensis]|nr:protein of unknown function [Aminobacter niigataensis]